MYGLDLKSMVELVQNCVELREINVGGIYSSLWKEDIKILFYNITPKIEKVSFGKRYWVEDEEVIALVKRCNKLKSLNLSGSGKDYLRIF